MSLAAARRSVEAVNSRDVDAFVECLHPDVEWEENGDVPGARVMYRGREEVRAWFEEVLREPWERFEIEIEEIEEPSPGAVVSGQRITALGRGSGVEIDLRFWTASWFEDGLVVKRKVFWTREEGYTAVRGQTP